MFDPTTTASETLDYSLLLVTHMICADRKIHMEETKALRQLARQTKVSDRTSEEMEKIFCREKGRLSLEEVAQSVPEGQRCKAMRKILAIAHVDDSFSPLEREMIERVGRIWSWSEGEIQRIIDEAECLRNSCSLGDNNDQP